MACVLVLVATWFHFETKPLEIPLPVRLSQLDPQLQAHIQDQVDTIKRRPKDLNRLATLGIIYSANSLWPEAREVFKLLEKLNPEEPLAVLYSGIASQELGEYDQAHEEFRKVARLFPEFPQTYYRLGELALRQGNPKEAETAFERLILLSPSEWRGYAGLGQVRQMDGQLDLAVEQYRKALQLDPDSPITHHLLGTALREQGKLEEAKRELSLGLNAQHYPMPDEWSVTAGRHMKTLKDQFEIAEEYGKMGSPLKAVEILEAARVFHPTNLSLLNNLSLAYLRANQIDLALSFSSQVIELDPDNLTARTSLATCFLALNQSQEALRHAEHAIALSPSTAHGYLAKANVLLSMQKDLEALAALQSAIQVEPGNAELLLGAGDICQFNLSDSEKALDYYLQAVDRNPAFLEAHRRLADYYARSGQSAESNDLLKRIDEPSGLSPSK